MTVNLAQASIKSTGSTTTRTFGMRFADVINVKDYGAIGNGIADDYSAIQLAFDAAFGTSSSPHGNGGGTTNTPVYFPKGTYKILTPLSVTSVWGGRILGDGQLSSIISFQGTITAVNADGICPALWLNGCNYCRIESLGFVATSDPTNHKTTCIWFGPDGVNGGTSSHGNTLIDVGTSTSSYGVYHGSTASAANSENTYINCNFSTHEQIGVFLSGANTLNIRIYGGGINFCGVAGIKTNNSAQIPVISNIAFDNNFCDVDLASASNGVIEGVRTESASFVKTNSRVLLNNCGQACQGGSITGSTSGTTLTVTVALSDRAIKPGMVIYGTDGTNALPTATPTRILAQLTGSTGSTGTYTLSASGSPGNLSSTTLTVRPVFINIVGSGLVDLSSCGSAFDPTILTANNSVLRIRNNGFYDQNTSAISADLFKYCIGQLLEYDVAALGSFLVASLPVAAAKFKGVHMFVTDSTVPGSTNFGATVSGTGANTVPVYCDGTNWIIG